MCSIHKYGIGRCDREKCVTCHTSRLSIGDHIINHITGEIIKLDFSGNCLTKNCIYIIQCKQPGCNVQYIGKTINEICSRMSQHMSSLKRSMGCKL